jgi:hypothetical protein
MSAAGQVGAASREAFVFGKTDSFGLVFCIVVRLRGASFSRR